MNPIIVPDNSPKKKKVKASKNIYTPEYINDLLIRNSDTHNRSHYISLSSAFCHLYFVIRIFLSVSILSSSFYYPHFSIRILSSTICCHPVLSLQRRLCDLPYWHLGTPVITAVFFPGISCILHEILNLLANRCMHCIAPVGLFFPDWATLPLYDWLGNG